MAIDASRLQMKAVELCYCALGRDSLSSLINPRELVCHQEPKAAVRVTTGRGSVWPMQSRTNIDNKFVKFESYTRDLQ